VVDTRRALLVLLLASGCATSLSGFQPAHVAPKGGVTAEAGFDVSVPTGTIIRTIDAAETLAKVADSRSLNDGERRQLIEAGANLAMVPPATVLHLGLTYAPFTDWELGVRWSSGAWRAGVRYQLLAQATHGLDLSAGVALSRFKYEFPIHKVIGDILRLDDFVRWSVDFPILVGKHASWYRLWGGPRILLSRFDAGLRLNLPAAAGAPAETVVASVDGTTAFLGGQGGVAVGYAHLFVGFELTIVQLISTGHLKLANQAQDVDLGGLIIYPGVALMGEF
jgi:hypothetical protein